MMFRKISAAVLTVTVAVTVGCGSLQKFSYDQKADGSSNIKAAGQSKDGSLKYKFEQKNDDMPIEKMDANFKTQGSLPRN